LSLSTEPVFHLISFPIFSTGTFNDWQKLRMNRSAKDFVAIVELAEGNHEYKFNVDGEWINDPNSPVVETSQGKMTSQIFQSLSQM
jgi:5'-AMP-activated protein kinase regulatory beta subunit